jgi:uncharacterized membrane protein
MEDLGDSSTGLEPNIAGLLAYVLGWITGLVFILIEKENKFVKFHAIQAIGFSIAFMILAVVVGVIPGIGPMLVGVLNLGGVVVWILCMVKAYQGQEFKLPVVGDIAAKQAAGPSA